MVTGRGPPSQEDADRGVQAPSNSLPGCSRILQAKLWTFQWKVLTTTFSTKEGRGWGDTGSFLICALSLCTNFSQGVLLNIEHDVMVQW